MDNPHQILDCTLRDGAYLVQSHFGDAAIRQIIAQLYEAQIDIIECGFLKNEAHSTGSTVFNQPQQLEQYLPTQRNRRTQHVLMADLSRYDIQQLDDFDGASIQGIRACFFKEERHMALSFCQAILDRGYQLYVQPVDILAYQANELIEMIEHFNPLRPKAFSIVDTFGAMHLHDLKIIFQCVDRHLDPEIQLGFHSHNNQQLSFALAQYLSLLCHNKRNLIIDTTLYGMGRGAGNTHTELIAHYFNQHQNSHYDLPCLLHLIEKQIIPLKQGHPWGYDLQNFVAGAYPTHVNTLEYLVQQYQTSPADLYQLLPQLDLTARKKYHYGEIKNTLQKVKP